MSDERDVVDLTKTYKQFHEPAESAAEIARPQELHATINHRGAGCVQVARRPPVVRPRPARAVLYAYGWNDVSMACGFALDSDADGPAPSKAKRAKKATKRASKKSAPRPMFDE